MKLIGKSDALKTTTPIPTTTTTTEQSLSAWVPEALTVPPETTTMETTTLDFNGQMDKMVKEYENNLAAMPSSLRVNETSTQTPIFENSTNATDTTTEAPYLLAFTIPRQLENGTFVTVNEPMPKHVSDLFEKMYMNGSQLPSSVVKIPITTEVNSTETPIQDV